MHHRSVICYENAYEILFLLVVFYLSFTIANIYSWMYIQTVYVLGEGTSIGRITFLAFIYIFFVIINQLRLSKMA